MKKFFYFFCALSLAALLAADAFADKEAEALLLLPDEETVSASAFSSDLENWGARILEIYSANVFRGYIPEEAESRLKEKYGAKIYRKRIDYMGEFAKFGEKGMLAAARWNNYMQENPDDAPLIIDMTAHRAGSKGKYLKLCWNNVPDAISYRLQTSHGKSFERVSFDAVTRKNCHLIMPAFWPDGVHYWRVAPSFKTVRKEKLSQGSFSEPSTFAVSKPAVKGKTSKLKALELPENTVAGRRLSWPSGNQKYFRLQVSDVKDFSVPAADVFSDTCSYRTSELQLKRGNNYYFRVMYSDGLSNSPWSVPAPFEYVNKNSLKSGKTYRTAK